MLLTSAQMRAIEGAAIDSGAVTGLQLMERAGRGTVAALLAEWPDLAARPGRAVVLCGPGNNGGDGFVIARRLHDRGWTVEVLLLGDPARLPGDARRNHDLWAAAGPVRPLAPETAAEGVRPDLLVDALFGTGLTRAIPDAAAQGLRAVRQRPADAAAAALRVVAVDCPSGLNCDSGALLLPASPGIGPETVAAELTVTFHRAKIGHYLGAPPSGRLEVLDIGLDAWDAAGDDPLLAPPPDRVRLVGHGADGRPLAAARWPAALLGPAAPGAHKYHRGHVLVLAGGVGRGGAARLAARAALRVGAGLVTLGCPPAALQENAARLDAIMLRPLRDAAALSALLEDARFSAVCLGPGLGVDARSRALVAAATGAGAAEHRRVVLDADTLTAFAEDPPALFALLHPGCVLTPHEGEFARIFPDLGQRARGGLSKVEAARQAAARAGCTVLLKGPDTVIASPDGAASIHAATGPRAAPWLGTAGAGDVLAGLIAGLLAGGGPVHPRVEAATWLHVECARAFGPGLIAEDLPETLPAVFRRLRL